MAEAVAYDLSLLKQLDDQSALLDVLDLFLRETPTDVQELALRTSAGEWKSASELAHKLKGSMAMLQVESLVSRLAAIEKTAKSTDDKDPNHGWVAKVTVIVDKLKAELTKETDTIRKEIG